MIVLVPRRSDGGPRDRLWEFTRQRWDGEIHEGYHDDGPFNRAAAINRAAANAGPWDVALVADADLILLDPAQASRACSEALRTGQLTYAHDRLVMTTESQMEAILAGANPDEATLGETRHPNCWSQALAVPRPLWEAVGGFEERMIGWGWEDLAFMSACWALGGGVGRVKGQAFHLWHPRLRSENEDSPTHAANQVLGQRYLAAKQSRQAMLAILAER